MSKLTFFRQSSWIMTATLLNGALMYSVHFVAGRMPKSEYGVFATLLQIVVLISIPTAGLQGIVASKAAAATEPGRERELNGMVRKLLGIVLVAWLAAAAIGLGFHRHISDGLKIANPFILGLTAVIGLVSLWRPILMGVIQGQQDFLWFGVAKMSEGAVRLLAVCIAVGWLGGYAFSAVTSVFCGVAAALCLAGWLSSRYLRGPADPVHPWNLVREIIPLTMGFGVATFMLSADMVFVRIFFSQEQTGFYAAAGMIGRALVFLTSSLSIVMYPKLARSRALGESSDALKLTLYTTLFCGAALALFCTFFPTLPLRVVYDNSYLAVSGPLVPWFAWCMLPLTLSNVLINSLMACCNFRAVPWLVLVAFGYGVTLYFFHETLQQVILVLGLYGIVLFSVCVWFVWGGGRLRAESRQPRESIA